MLDLLRNKAQSTIIKIIVAVIALVFIFWGVGANLSGNRQTAILVNDKEISFLQYQRVYDTIYEQLATQFGGSIPKELAKQFNIKQQAINQLVQQELVRQGAQTMGIIVSDEYVRKSIMEMPQFQKDGTFDMETYEKVLKTNRPQFEKQIKKDYLSRLAMFDVSQFAGYVGEFEIGEMYSEINEKVAVDFIPFFSKDFTDKVVIDETTLNKWYNTVKDKYKLEPKKKLRYITFLYNDIAKQIQIEEAAINSYYQDNKIVFTEKTNDGDIIKPLEEVRNEITEKLKQKEAQSLAFQLANDTYEAIINAGSIDAYTASHEQTNNSFQKTDFITGKTAPQVIADDENFLQASFALNKKELSSLIKGNSGYAIFYLDDIQEAVIPKITEVKEKVEKDYRKKQSVELAKKAAQEFLEKIKGNKDTPFNKLAQDSGYMTYDSGLLTRRNQPKQKNDTAKTVNLPTRLVPEIFQLSTTQPFTDDLAEDDGNFYILYFQKRELPTMPVDSPEYALYKGSMRNIKQQQLFEAWLQYLRSNADVRYHQSLE